MTYSHSLRSGLSRPYSVMKILSSVNKNSIVVRKAKDEEDAVAFWHEHETGNTLMEYMQMTEAEYEAFIKK